MQEHRLREVELSRDGLLVRLGDVGAEGGGDLDEREGVAFVWGGGEDVEGDEVKALGLGFGERHFLFTCWLVG